MSRIDTKPKTYAPGNVYSYGSFERRYISSEHRRYIKIVIATKGTPSCLCMSTGTLFFGRTIGDGDMTNWNLEHDEFRASKRQTKDRSAG